MQANGLTATAKLYDDNGNVEEEIPVDYNGYLEASKIEEPDPAAYGVWIPGIPGLVEKGLQAVHCAQWLQQLILNGVIAGVGAVIASVVWDMGGGILKQKSAVSDFIMLAAFLATCVFRVNVVYIILACIALGVLRTVLAKRRTGA